MGQVESGIVGDPKKVREINSRDRGECYFGYLRPREFGEIRLLPAIPRRNGLLIP